MGLQVSKAEYQALIQKRQAYINNLPNICNDDEVIASETSRCKKIIADLEMKMEKSEPSDAEKQKGLGNNFYAVA